MRPIDRIGQRKALTINGTFERDADGFMTWTSSYSADKEQIESSFEGYVGSAYKANGIVFACILARMLPFSEARFQFQELLNGRPGKLFDDDSLRLLDSPWPNGTTGELLARMEQDASLAGNFYATTVGSGADLRIRRLRPDWVTIISGVRNRPGSSPYELEAEVLAYIYEPKDGKGVEPVLLMPDRVVHYSPIPDPTAQWRGMSWITPLVSDVRSDTLATKHKLKFFTRGASLNVVMTYDKSIKPAEFQRYVELFDAEHVGADNAYRTLHVGGGADPKIVGTDLKSIDFKAVQGAGETRIAAAAGVGAIIARFSEGMQGSALNQGNYSAAKRQFADMTLRPLWRTAASSLAKFTKPSRDSRLWYDVRDIEFLKEDRKDAAEIMSTHASTIKSLVDAGYKPDSVVEAVDSGDFSRLQGEHSGLFSVQLQPPGAGTLPAKTLAEFVLKYGARNSSSDLALIQTAHDAIAAAGAECPAPSEGGA